ncbi:MAG: EF-hand domain-containing protein [Betaproteobacteria bacterium]|nr:EF-hand domain-containing protein [Betaproteobacteria bacterium]
MKTTTLIAVSAIAFIAAFQPAHAGEGKGDRAQKVQERLKAADKDGDGKISKAEADTSLPRIAKQFGDIDTNKDGFVTKEELRAWHQKNGGARKGQKS